MKNFLEGEIILIDKPYGWTSFELVKKVRNRICKKLSIKKLKVGHAGTLDPLASGLMILCTGKATKQIQSYQDQEKEYVAEITLGATTPSFDMETEIDKTHVCDQITETQVKEVLDSFLGQQEQMPPVYSAKNINGVRAYEYARKGEKLDMKSHKIQIFSVELINFCSPVVVFQVICSKGTYIRSLARDIGIRLDCGAYLSNLKRTRIGNFSINHALTWLEFEKKIRNL